MERFLIRKEQEQSHIQEDMKMKSDYSVGEVPCTEQEQSHNHEDMKIKSDSSHNEMQCIDRVLNPTWNNHAIDELCTGKFLAGVMLP